MWLKNSKKPDEIIGFRHFINVNIQVKEKKDEKKKKQKGCLAVAALMAVATLWMLPIKAEADCGEGIPTGKVGGYCATPICHNGNRTYFVQREYVRTCTNELGTKYEDTTM